MTAPTPAPVPPKALTIAGSDSGGGAGIQADLKTFAALGVYGSSVITAITAQNTLTVSAVQEISTDLIGAQIDAVMEDIGADAVKTGMLSSPGIVRAVSDGIRRHDIRNLVVDPVMIAKSGDRLLHEDAVSAVKEHLLPLARVVTPNIPEAEVLAGMNIASQADMIEAAKRIHQTGPEVVIVKGGHLADTPIDIAWDGYSTMYFETARVDTTSTHGTGCTFSAAIAAHLARGYPINEAVERSKRYLFGALMTAYRIGAGHSPVHHFHELWSSKDEH
jgi:hydroxymethylpyrimidine/phosphomethylpyrimidine kinase